MNITTKYEVGQEVYYLSRKSNKIEQAKIYKIEVTIGSVSEALIPPVEITYYMWQGNNVETASEDLCRLTKQQLLDSL